MEIHDDILTLDELKKLHKIQNEEPLYDYEDVKKYLKIHNELHNEI